MVPGSTLFGLEAKWSRDVLHANICVRCGATPSPKISRTGSAPGGTSRREEERRGEEKREGRGRAWWRAAGVEVHGRLRSGELRRWRSGETEIHRHRARPWEQSSAPGAIVVGHGELRPGTGVPGHGELRPWRHRARPRRAPPPAGARALGPALPPRRRRRRAARGQAHRRGGARPSSCRRRSSRWRRVADWCERLLGREDKGRERKKKVKKKKL